MPNSAQQIIVEDNQRYTKRGVATGVVGGVTVGAAVTQGAVWGGAFGAPFGGVGALPGAAIGAIAGLVAGVFAGGISGKIVDKIVRKEVHEIATRQTEQQAQQARQQQQINFLLNAHRDFETERAGLIQQNTRLEKRLHDALTSIQSCNSSTHSVLRMSMTGIPEGLICPITQEIFKDPVTLALSGSNGRTHKTYERQAIMNWKTTRQAENRPFLDPLTRLPIITDPQSVLTDEIKEEQVRQFLSRCPEHYHEQHQIPRPSAPTLTF